MLWLSSEPDKRQTTQSELAITGGIIKYLEKPIVSGMAISRQLSSARGFEGEGWWSGEVLIHG